MLTVMASECTGHAQQCKRKRCSKHAVPVVPRARKPGWLQTRSCRSNVETRIPLSATAARWMYTTGLPSGMSALAFALLHALSASGPPCSSPRPPTGGRVLGNRLVTGLTTDPDSGEVTSVEATDRATGEQSTIFHTAV